VADIRAGVDDGLIKEKYGLSDKSLASAYEKLKQAGLLSEADLSNRPASVPVQEQSSVTGPLIDTWQCPCCGTAQAKEIEECPVCGIVVQKFVARKERDEAAPVDTEPIRHSEASIGPRWGLIAVILLIVAAIGVPAAWFLFAGEPEPQRTTFKVAPLQPRAEVRPNKNALAIKDRAVTESIEIRLNPLMDLNFKTKAEVLNLRSDAISQYPELMAGEYMPSDAVFGQIVDGLPWWGILGAFHYGPGGKSILGPSLHSASIVNPYLLVVPDFHMRWDAGAVEGMNEQMGFDSLYCVPRSLRWHPKLGRAEVSYDGACLLKNRVGAFSLAAFNARDLNLRYMYVSYRDSRNILKTGEPTEAYENPQYIHQGGSCGYPGGCNNMSPATPPIDNIRILGLPVTVVIHLWENDPGSIDKAPDMQYTMHFH
jgi:hypothetical protein